MDLTDAGQIITVVATVATAVYAVWYKINGGHGKRRRVTDNGDDNPSVMVHRDPGAGFSGDQSGQFNIWSILSRAIEQLDHKVDNLMQVVLMTNNSSKQIEVETREIAKIVDRLETTLDVLKDKVNELKRGE